MAKSPSAKKSPKTDPLSTPAPEVLLPASAKTSSKLKSSLQKAADMGAKLQSPAPEHPPVEEAKTIAATATKKKKAVKINLAKPAAKPKKAAVSKEKKTSTPLPPAESQGSARRILFITAECTPLAQTGGLGDAVAGLSKTLLKRGHDVRIVMPLYGRIDRHKYNITFSRTCCVHFGRGEEIWVGIYEGKLDGQVPIWFIDYERYFGRHEIYSGDEDAYRFGVLSKAALQICKDVDWIPHVAHVHDWMTAIAAVFLKTWDRVLSPLSTTASVLTIHNIGYQGNFDNSVLGFYGFGADYLTPDKFEDFGRINLLKAGIQYADDITTVSPTYANEIKGPIGGMGMGMYLNDRGDRVSGVLNGVDTTVWNPAIDPYLPARYSRDNLAGKAECKRALQERFGLTVDPKIPLFAVISRFAPQKGFDLMRGSLPQALRDMIMQVVVLGTGDAFTEHFFRWLTEANPGRANAHIGFAPEVAHLMEAGSDFFIMPSIYEPCGLNQMYSSIYGTLPIVRATGGLDDTVENYNEAAGTGTGFKFWEISGRALYYTIGWAVATWYDRPHHIAAMQQQGMSRDFTWENSAKQYERVYENAIAHRAAL
jgi:starch synthase